MRDAPKHIRKLLRQHAGMAHEEELRRALLPLADDFDRWRRSEIDSLELNERIHRFQDGPARKLWLRYNEGMPELSVSYAIHYGILNRKRVPAELLEHLANGFAFWRDQDRSSEEARMGGEDGDEGRIRGPKPLHGMHRRRGT